MDTYLHCNNNINNNNTAEILKLKLILICNWQQLS